MKVLFLYTELADYFIKCCEKLSESCEVHIVRWPVNKEAPFAFQFKGITVYEKNNYSTDQLIELANSLAPDIIICSGWVDRDYLKVVGKFAGKIPTVMTCDTKWRGSLRQYAALVLSRFFLIRIFSHAWVPGKSQSKYVRMLGFRKSKIHQGFYCCDLPKFNRIYQERSASTQKKRFLYVGRYYEFKGVPELWKAFAELQKENFNEWELWCLGTGDLKPVEDPSIRHFGFVQPSDLDPILKECSVFVLPSRFEPWGVVVQEYAAAGFPLLISKEVGAREMFLEEGQNGYSFTPGSSSQIKAALKKVINLSPKELNSMSEVSHRLAQRHTPEQWANTVLKIYYESKKE